MPRRLRHWAVLTRPPVVPRFLDSALGWQGARRLPATRAHPMVAWGHHALRGGEQKEILRS
eukprot:3374845-Alexandrium_andersonii.AAC.1